MSEDTARAILDRHGVEPVGSGRPRYGWIAIWRVEGEPWVSPWDWPTFREPLLAPTDLLPEDPKGRRARTIRRLLQQGRIPSIQLSPGIRRVRAHILERVIGHV